MVTQILPYFTISCFLAKQQIIVIRFISNELRLVRFVSPITVFLRIMHVARHTAATIVFLANKVSLENVAKILGHSNVRTTQHYAKVLDSSIIRDIKESINREIHIIESEENNIFQKSISIISLLELTFDKLKEFVSNFSFKSQLEEITFFKETKPQSF